MNNVQFGFTNEQLVSDFAYDVKIKKKCADGSNSAWSSIFRIPHYQSNENICNAPNVFNIGWKRVSDTEVAFDYIDEASQYFIEFIGTQPTNLGAGASRGEDHSIIEYKKS